MSLATDIARIALDRPKLQSIVNGDAATTVATDGGVVPSLSRLLSQMGAGTIKGAWVTATAYVLGDVVTNGGTAYRCIVAHTSAAALATDLTASKWIVHYTATSAVSTMSALKAAANTYGTILLHGYVAAGDGGGGMFWWDAASSAADDGGTIIQPAALPATGRWKRIYSGELNVRWFGAQGDGVTDDSGAFRLALNAVPVKGGTVVAAGGTFYFATVVYIPQRFANDGVGTHIRGENATIKGTGLGGNTLFESGKGATSTATNFGEANESATSTHYGDSITGFTFRDCGTAIRVFNFIQRCSVKGNWFYNCTMAGYFYRCFYMDLIDNHAYLGSAARAATDAIFWFDNNANVCTIEGNSANGLYLGVPKGIGFKFSSGLFGSLFCNNAPENCVTGVSLVGEAKGVQMLGNYVEGNTTGFDLGSAGKAGLTIDGTYMFANATGVIALNWQSGIWGDGNVVDGTGDPINLSAASNLMRFMPAVTAIDETQATATAVRIPATVSLSNAARVDHRRLVYDSSAGYANILVIDEVHAKRTAAFQYTGGNPVNGPATWVPFVDQTKPLGSTTLDTDIDWSDRRMIIVYDIKTSYVEGGSLALQGFVFSNNVIRALDATGTTIVASSNGGKLRLVITHAAKTSSGWYGQIRHM